MISLLFQKKNLVKNALLGTSLLLFPLLTLASEIEIISVTLSDPGPYLKHEAYRAYVITQNNTAEEFTGTIEITFENDKASQPKRFGEKLITILPEPKQDGIFIDGQFSLYGNTQLMVTLKDVDNEPISNLESTLLVDIDSDKDGVLNSVDTDDDNDGLPDTWEETYGLDPLKDDTKKDFDGDGISNGDEYRKETDPTREDSDGDGMPDAWEIKNGLNPTQESSEEDSDSDGLSNFEEYQRDTDPQAVDTDTDGLPDWWEVLHSSNPTNPHDAETDFDRDGYNALEEYTQGTNPGTPKKRQLANQEPVGDFPYESPIPPSQDLDNDRIPDAEEASLGLRLNAPDGKEDSDGDGLPNWFEYSLGIDLQAVDTDRDGLPDGWEYNNGLDPINPLDRESDLDEDKVPAWGEFAYNLNPTSPYSHGLIHDSLSYWIKRFWILIITIPLFTFFWRLRKYFRD